MKYFLITLFLLIAFIGGYSQDTEQKKDKYKLVFNFDMRNSFVKGNSVKFNGYKIGLGNSKHRFGLGIYGLREPIFTTNAPVDSIDATDTSRFKYNYLSLYFEHIAYQSKRWEISVPLHLNFGNLEADYKTIEGKYKRFLTSPATSLTLSVKGHFKVFRWIGFGSGIGYNLLLVKEKKTRKALNAPFYSFGVKIFLGELWRVSTNKEYRKSDWID